MKKVIITGASRGIGKAVAEKFLGEGWAVVGTSTSGSGWEDKNLAWIKLNLADPVSIEQASKEIAARGSSDVLINNSGINEESEDHEGAPVSIPVLRTTLEINLIGTIDFTERLLSSVNPKGHIIFLGSRMGSHTAVKGSFAPSYSISKAALGMYTQRLASRLRDSGVIASIVNPGWVQTDMGGDEAPRTTGEAAADIYTLAISAVPTGKFWYKGEEQAW